MLNTDTSKENWQQELLDAWKKQPNCWAFYAITNDPKSVLTCMYEMVNNIRMDKIILDGWIPKIIRPLGLGDNGVDPRSSAE